MRGSRLAGAVALAAGFGLMPVQAEVAVEAGGDAATSAGTSGSTQTQTAADTSQQPSPQVAQTTTGEPETVTITSGRAEREIGVAVAASEGVVAGVDLTTRPILRVGELFETVPGLIAAQHSGSGKANQYFLRGINLDHGTDFTSIIDDVPWNFRTHGHGQGYLDVNGLIPETVARIDYRKGPYRADLGDFSLAGAAILTTVDGYDRPWIQGE